MITDHADCNLITLILKAADAAFFYCITIDSEIRNTNFLENNYADHTN